MTSKKTGLIVSAFLVIAVAVALSGCSRGEGLIFTGAHPTKGLTGWSDTEATFTLREVGGVCTLTGKDTEVEVAKDKKITWTVRNFCSQPQVVTVGNFRTGTSTRTDCGQGTEGITWPFNANDENVNKRQAKPGGSNGSTPTEDKFKLNDAKNGTSNPLYYQFDVCVGSGSGTKVDPRLVIDP